MKATTKDTCGSSYFGYNVTATPAQMAALAAALGTDANYGYRPKTQYAYEFETEDGDLFTVYDWKYYRGLGHHEPVTFHIGGFNSYATAAAQSELMAALDALTTEQMNAAAAALDA